MRAPTINTQSAAQRIDLEQALAQSARGADLDGAFSEVLDLVQPRELPKTEPAEAPREVKEPQERSELTTRETQEREAITSEPREVKGREAAERVSVAQAKEAGSRELQSTQEGEGVDRAEALRLVQQLSQEDLLKLVELSQGTGLELNPELSALEAEALPAIKALSPSEIMALLNGFQDAQQPLQQALQLEGGAQSAQLNEQLFQQTQAQAHSQALQLNTQQLNTQQQLQPQLNPVAAMPAMQAVARPQEVMPALNQVKLTEAQRDGILRQVANGFRAKGAGTQTTELRLHPEELGLVRLKVEMRGTDVRVFFSADNPAVMELLSNNIDQLKSMLLEQDFNLSEASVWRDFGGQGQGASERGPEGEDYGSDERPDLRHRPKSGPRMSPLPGRFRATV